jgi:hypothetical protein
MKRFNWILVLSFITLMMIIGLGITIANMVLDYLGM